MNTQSEVPLSFNHGARYRIRVQGRVPARWLDRLAGMAVSVAIPDAGQPVTTLVGEVGDQAAVMGVLNTLYELRLALISVECLGQA